MAHPGSHVLGTPTCCGVLRKRTCRSDTPKRVATASIDTTETTLATAAGEVRARNKEILFAALAEAIEAWDGRNEKIPLPCDAKIQLVSGHPEHRNPPGRAA
jgi:hypothetical protein